MAGDILPGVRLEPGEEIDLSVEASPYCHIVLTNQRVVVWQHQEGVEQITPITLEHLLGMEVRKGRGQIWPLVAGLGLSIIGAPLLPRLISGLSGEGEGGSIALSLSVGTLGLGLVVAGLVSLSFYLRRALFPQVQVVFYGAPQVVVEVPAEARGRLRRFSQRLKELKRSRE